ncbi:hypothetical protein G6F31_019383 [Rhizopus arrhizus]|nr:hypothetical protein G6F31_019383 [Rhizopus arrhizus]
MSPILASTEPALAWLAAACCTSALGARHRVGLQPLAVDEAIEVGTGRNGRVQIGAVERDQRRLDLRLIEGRLGIGGGGRRGFILATGSQRGGDGDRQAQRDQIADVHEALLRVISQGSPRHVGRGPPKVTPNPGCHTMSATRIDVRWRLEQIAGAAVSIQLPPPTRHAGNLPGGQQ